MVTTMVIKSISIYNFKIVIEIDLNFTITIIEYW